MSNCMIGFPNRIDECALSGGSWLAALPLTNLQDRRLGVLAKSTNALAASTKFDIALTAPKKIRIVTAVNHNFTVDATYRLRGSLVSDFSTTAYDSGAVFGPVWPAVYPTLTLDWEDPNWWSGTYTTEQAAGYTAALTIVLPQNIFARYWRLEIVDTTNPAGYVQLGRVFIGPAWQTPVNLLHGASLGWETDTQVQKARSGAEYFSRRTPYRVQKFELDDLTQDEAFARAFEIQRQAGIDKEIMWVHDPEDTTHALRRQYLGRLRTLSAIEYPRYNVNKTGFEIKELL